MPPLAQSIYSVEDARFVVLAVIMSFLLCHLGFNAFNRTTIAAGRSLRVLWLAISAIATGSGIWTSQALLDLALHVSLPISLDRAWSLLALLFTACLIIPGYSVAAAARGRRSLIIGGGMMTGCAIAGAHFVFMAGSPITGHVHYDPLLILASIVAGAGFGVSAFLAASRHPLRQFIAAILMTLGIAAVQLTALASVSIATDAGSEGFVAGNLRVGLALGSLGLAAVAVFATFLDQRWASRMTRSSNHLRRAAVAWGLAKKQIRHLELHDGVTGLPNRMLFADRLDQEIIRSRHAGATIAVLCIGISNLAPVNRLLGHQVGDTLLQALGDRIGLAMGSSDKVARLGGNHFAAFHREGSSPESAGSLGRKLADTLAAPFQIDGKPVTFAPSIGIAFYPYDGSDADVLLRNADIARDQAHMDGGSPFRSFDQGMNARLQVRRELERDIENALKLSQFELYYQPIFDCQYSSLCGFEALIRWNHPVRGFVSPADFIPLAEESDLILPLSEWVLETACSEAATWPDDLGIAVNLSPVQFHRSDVVALVKSVLGRSGLAPERLELEVTEGIYITDTDQAFATMAALRELGTQISLDDFGSGYSSLAYIQRFPFDKIKIDRCFIREMESSANARAIIGAVISLGEALGLTVLAEGVETDEQLSSLRDSGCGQIQGYLLGRPIPQSALLQLIRRQDFLSLVQGSRDSMARRAKVAAVRQTVEPDHSVSA